jgi:Bacterial Ig-like domain (group 1).
VDRETPDRETGFAVRANDSFGNPVRGESVTIADAGGIAGLEGATAVTDDAGDAVFSFRGVREGNYTVGVEAGGETRDVNVTVSANDDGVSGGAGGALAITAPTGAVAGQEARLTVTAMDERGVFVEEEEVQIRSGGGLGLSARKIPPMLTGSHSSRSPRPAPARTPSRSPMELGPSPTRPR